MEKVNEDHTIDDNNGMITPRTHIRRFGLCLTFLLITCLQVRAGVLEGNIYTDLYGLESQDTTHVHSYSGGRVSWNLWKRSLRRIDLQTSFRYATTLKGNNENIIKTYVREGYVRFSGLPAHSEIRLGRQFLYSNLTAVLVDGAYIDYAVWPEASLTLFGGSTVASFSPGTVRDLSDYAVAGASIRYSNSPLGAIGVNWLYRRDRGYLVSHLVGLDIERRVGISTLYAVGAFNRNQNRLANLTGRIAARPHGWYLAAEYRFREPWVSDASLFGIINFNRYQQARLEARRLAWRTVSIGGQFLYSLGESDDTWRSMLGISAAFGSLGWSHQEGHGTYSDGIYGTLTARVHPRMEIYGNTNLSRYRVQSEQEEYSDSYGSAIGFLWRGPSGWSCRAECQWFRNAVSTSDGRLYLQVAKDFSIGSDGKGAK